MTKIIVAALLAILGIVFLIGKGDRLIAGYNTSSEKVKEKYDIHKLRILMGTAFIILGILFYFFEGLVFSAIAIAFAFVLILLANTWAKK